MEIDTLVLEDSMRMKVHEVVVRKIDGKIYYVVVLR